MPDLDLAARNFSKDLNNLIILVQHAADTTLHGSYSERRPDLGRMRTCLSCGVRRRENSERCCNPKWSTHIKGREVPPRENDADVFIRKFKKTLFKKHHGQNRAFKITQLSARFREDLKLRESAAKEMHVKVPAPEHIGAFAEKFFHWREKRIVRAARRRTNESRRINRGN